MSKESLIFNGINGATGDYLLPEMKSKQISEIARGEEQDDEYNKELRWWYQQISSATFAPKEGIDSNDLAQSGWGVIFAHGADPSTREALSELLEHRRMQATKKYEHYYKEYVNADAYRPGESKPKFLARHGAGPGVADPENVPYYLLIVGDPESIPYRFQYQLDVQYAVGRIHFNTLDEYAQYAHTVVTAETGGMALPRQTTFFGVENPDDRATKLSTNHLIKPLAELLAKEHSDWKIQSVLGNEATKAKLGQFLGGSETPALLFTAGHGMGFPDGHELQLSDQGALLCSDWPGPLNWKKAISRDHYFSGTDLADNAHLNGLVTFHFACYGAGTPRLDDFAHQAFKKPVSIAPHAFISRLPQRMLGHPKGGALAVIGHVERAWGYSFMWERAGRQLAVFESALKRLLKGNTVGSAMEYFNERYAELASDLSVELEDIEKYGKIPDDDELAGMWTANNDARSYVIIGDPAVRLCVA